MLARANESFWPSISADGRYVAFTSGASNLVSGDTNGTLDIFVRDRGGGRPLLDLPFDYPGRSTGSAAALNSAFLGRTTAVFDHDKPWDSDGSVLPYLGYPKMSNPEGAYQRMYECGPTAYYCMGGSHAEVQHRVHRWRPVTCHLLHQ